MRVIQMLDALDYGDGVSNDVIHLHEMMDSLRIPNRIYSKYWNENVARYTESVERYCANEDDLILYHFSGESCILESILKQPCRKLVRYHNVTPPELLMQDNPVEAEKCRAGLRQIQANISEFDGFLAVSQFNADDLLSYGAAEDRVEVLPIVFDFEKFRHTAKHSALGKKLSAHPYFIFVGRMAKNKCIEDVMLAFEYYFRFHDASAYLYLVGNDTQTPDYTERLQHLRNSMASKEHIVFTGKVSEDDLAAYYRGASAFLCMSEHEGFCMPLLEAANFDIPVIAYASCAIPDTMGDSGIQLHKKSFSTVAHLMEMVLNDSSLRRIILTEQQNNLKNYSREVIESRLRDVLKKWEGRM